MARIAWPLALPLVALLATSAPQEPRTIGKLGAAGTFFYPAFAGQQDHVVAQVAGENISGEMYGRYLAARLGTRYLEDLAFEIALARECKARGLARGAPTLARGVAAAQLRESGRTANDDLDASLQRRFANDALRKQRSEALVRADRLADPEALRAVFNHRFGQDGVRVRVRQILVSFAATRRRLLAAGLTADEDQVEQEARARAQSIHDSLANSEFTTLLPESDDTTTRRMLRQPNQAAEAGFLPGYNYRRYGSSFADAVRGLAVGQISAPVRSDTGLHLIRLVERKVTKFQDVKDTVRKELSARKSSQAERTALRRALLDKYGFQPKYQ